MRLSSIIKEALYEEVESKMKLFYKTDIFMRRTEAQMQAKKEDEEEEPELEEPDEEEIEVPEEEEGEGEEGEDEEDEEGEEEEDVEESVKKFRGSLLNEETFRTKTEGVINVSHDEARNIKILPHLLGFINRQTDPNTGKQIINDLVVEVVSTIVNEGANAEILKSLIFKDDKINVTVNYGTEQKENSVGFEITKNIGVEEVTLTLLMEDKPQQSFSLNSFNSKLNLLQMDLRKD